MPRVLACDQIADTASYSLGGIVTQKEFICLRDSGIARDTQGN